MPEWLPGLFGASREVGGAVGWGRLRLILGGEVCRTNLRPHFKPPGCRLSSQENKAGLGVQGGGEMGDGGGDLGGGLAGKWATSGRRGPQGCPVRPLGGWEGAWWGTWRPVEPGSVG